MEFKCQSTKKATARKLNCLDWSNERSTTRWSSHLSGCHLRSFSLALISKTSFSYLPPTSSSLLKAQWHPSSSWGDELPRQPGPMEMHPLNNCAPAKARPPSYMHHYLHFDFCSCFPSHVSIDLLLSLIISAHSCIYKKKNSLSKERNRTSVSFNRTPSLIGSQVK